MNYIIWKDINSKTIKGLLISELPPISKPNQRITETMVEGVDGSIIEKLGYDPYDKPMLISLTRDFDIDEIIEYFNGDGQVVFSNEPDKVYNATIISQIDYTRLMRFRTATVTFRVQPFKYEYQEETTIASSKNLENALIIVENKGNYFSKPIITIAGSGKITLAVNDNTLFSYTFPDGEDAVVIDSQKQDAYIGTALKNRNMTGEFPTLEVGDNVITWDGTITNLEISMQSRWL